MYAVIQMAQAREPAGAVQCDEVEGAEEHEGAAAVGGGSCWRCRCRLLVYLLSVGCQGSLPWCPLLLRFII